MSDPIPAAAVDLMEALKASLDRARNAREERTRPTERSTSMEHSTTVTAVLTGNEPPSGTVLIVKDGDEYKAIVRNDGAAREADYDDHWFDASDTEDEPMALHEHIKYADAVYALGEALAVFR